MATTKKKKTKPEKSKTHLTRKKAAPLRIKQRGSHSIELKFRYLLNKKKGRKKHTYDVNIFFFLPYSFNIDLHTYDRSSFYDDMKLFLRFNTPMFTAKELLDSNFSFSPLVRIEKMVENARATGRIPTPEDFVYEGKLLACIYKSLLRDGLSELHGDTEKTASIERSGKKISATFKEIREVARRFHRLTADLNSDLPNAPEEILQHAKMIDEHLSLLVEKYLTSLLVLLDKEETRDQYTRIEKIIEKEIQYRNTQEYPTVMLEHTDKKNLEEHIYREKMLKRYSSEVLFFDVRRRNTAKGMEQILYSIAAGIAMIFATAAAFFGQSVYGRLTTSLFIVMVISYMAKDRIKDLFRDVLTKSIGSYFFDRVSLLFDARYKRKLAAIKERTFFTRENKTDPEILAIRKKGSFEKLLSKTAKETIFTYKKRITLYSGALKRIHQRIIGLADINIIDLGRFFKHLASQGGIVPSLSEGGNISLHPVKRIYHLNMIVQIKNQKGSSFFRYRLVVDANGIKRIEQVVSQKRKKK